MRHVHTRDVIAQEERIKRLFKSTVQNIGRGIQFVPRSDTHKYLVDMKCYRIFVLEILH